MNQRDLTLLTDFYELTMMQGYYEKGQNEIVIFDVFYVLFDVVYFSRRANGKGL